MKMEMNMVIDNSVTKDGIRNELQGQAAKEFDTMVEQYLEVKKAADALAKQAKTMLAKLEENLEHEGVAEVVVGQEYFMHKGITRRNQTYDMPTLIAALNKNKVNADEYITSSIVYDVDKKGLAALEKAGTLKKGTLESALRFTPTKNTTFGQR